MVLYTFFTAVNLHLVFSHFGIGGTQLNCYFNLQIFIYIKFRAIFCVILYSQLIMNVEDSTSFPMIPNSYKLKGSFWNTSLQSVNFLLFSLYFAHCFAHYLRINLADKMSLLLLGQKHNLNWPCYEKGTNCIIFI